MADRTCARCSGPLPAHAQTNRIYCSKRCVAASYRASGRGTPVERQREYAAAYRTRQRAALLQERPERSCEECGAEIPAEARADRRYCSRRCINRAAMRNAPEQKLAANRRRRARIRSADSPGVLERDWCRLVERYRGSCAYCGQREQLTMDHVVPISRGGRHAIGNVLPACFPCNASKRDDFLAAWRIGRGTQRFARRAA
jgi:5-methylcytosine-specific restriction endonuclease McrA